MKEYLSRFGRSIADSRIGQAAANYYEAARTFWDMNYSDVKHAAADCATAVGRFAKNYWDLPVAITGGWLLANSLEHPLPSREMFEGPAIYSLPVLARILRNDENGALRDTAAGLSAMLISLGFSTENPAAIAIGYGATGLTSAIITKGAIERMEKEEPEAPQHHMQHA